MFSKILKYIITVIMIFNFGCQPEELTISKTIKGFIFSGNIENIIKQVEVIYLNDNGETEKCISDTTGNYIFDNILGNQITITFTKKGYITYQEPLLLTKEGEQIRNINLKKIPFKISGIIYSDSLTNKLPNVKIEAQNIGINIGSAISNSNGEYTLDSILYDNVTITYEKEGYEIATHIVDISAENVTKNVSLTKYSTIRGYIYYGQEENRITGVRIEVLDNLNKTINNIYTTSNGEYIIQDLQRGEYTLKMTKDGYTESSVNVTLISGIDREININLNQENLSSISGTVEGESDPYGIEYALVELSNNVYTNSTSSNILGDYDLKKIPAGDYMISFSKAGYQTHTQSITIGYNSSIKLDAFLNNITTSLTGFVFSKMLSNKIEGVKVTVEDNSYPYDDYGPVMTNEKGEYTINNLYNGSVDVTFSKDGYNDVISIIDLRRNELNKLDIELTEKQASISGYIYSENTTKKISNAAVELYQNNQIIDSDITSTDGKYNFTNLQSGDYEIKVSKQGYNQNSKTISFHIGEDKTLYIDIIPLKFYISGYVFEPNGTTPISSASVLISELSRTVYTNSTGQFSFENIPTGTYQFVFSKNNYLDINKSIPISQNLTDISVSLNKINTITINVVDDNGLPASNIPVEIHFEQEENYTTYKWGFEGEFPVIKTEHTDSDGNCTFTPNSNQQYGMFIVEALPSGNYGGDYIAYQYKKMNNESLDFDLQLATANDDFEQDLNNDGLYNISLENDENGLPLEDDYFIAFRKNIDTRHISFKNNDISFWQGHLQLKEREQDNYPAKFYLGAVDKGSAFNYIILPSFSLEMSVTVNRDDFIGSWQLTSNNRYKFYSLYLLDMYASSEYISGVIRIMKNTNTVNYP